MNDHDNDQPYPEIWMLYSNWMQEEPVDLTAAIDSYARRAATIQELKDACGVS